MRLNRTSLLAFIITVAILVSFAGGALVSGGKKVIDGLGRPVRPVEKEEARIVSTYTGLTDIVVEIGGREMLVGVSSGDKRSGSYPGAVSVGNHHRPDVETIMSLHPDLVLVSSRIMPDVLKVLERTNIRFAAFHPKSLSELPLVVRSVGRLIGLGEPAERLAARLQEIKEELEQEAQSSMPKPRVFVEVRHSPQLLTRGRNSIASEVISLAGGINIVEASETTVVYSIERLLAEQPDIVLIQSGPMNPSTDLEERDYLHRLKAYRTGNVYVIDGKFLSRAGPQSLEGAKRLARIFETWRRSLTHSSPDAAN